MADAATPQNWTYGYINDLGDAGAMVPIAGDNYDKEYYSKLNYMTQDEVATYNYLYHTQGSDAADQYLDVLTDPLFARQGEDLGAASNLPVARGIFGAVQGARSVFKGLAQNLMDAPMGYDAYDYAAGYIGQNAGWLGQKELAIGQSVGGMLPSLAMAYLSKGFLSETGLTGSAAARAAGAALRNICRVCRRCAAGHDGESVCEPPWK